MTNKYEQTASETVSRTDTIGRLLEFKADQQAADEQVGRQDGAESEIILYHRTNSAESARSILSEGFRDGEGYYLLNIMTSGVFLSNAPLDVNEGTGNGPLLEVRLGSVIAVSPHRSIADICDPLLHTTERASLYIVQKIDQSLPVFGRDGSCK